MSEARTKLDILYQDVLGDVKEILDHMDALKVELPNAFEGSVTSLQKQSDNLTSTAEKLNQNVNDITKRIDAYVSAAASSAGDAVRVNVRQGVIECLHTLVLESLLPIIQKANTNSEGSLKQLLDISNAIESKITSDAEIAINALKIAVETLKKNVEKEGEKIEENKWRHLQYTSIGALFGTGAAIGISTIFYILMH
jgi:prefoldin subunit 5